jgi:hypothetical protein
MPFKRRKYTHAMLAPLAAESRSVAQIIRKLGMQWSGGTQNLIMLRLREYEIDISHFAGQAASTGDHHRGGSEKKTHSMLLVRDRHSGRREPAHRLRRAMLEAGFLHRCAVCALPPVWNGKPLTLQVDHRDGDNTNNEPTNVRFICANCHTQTENFAGRGAGKVRVQVA